MEEKSNTQHTEPFENIPAVEMPQPLVDLALKRYAFAAIFFCIGVAASICVKSVCGLIVAFPALYLLYLASITVTSGSTAVIRTSDAPQSDPVGVLISKQGDDKTPLTGAQFTYRYYDGQYNTVAAAEASGSPTRIWVFETQDGVCR